MLFLKSDLLVRDDEENKQDLNQEKDEYLTSGHKAEEVGSREGNPHIDSLTNIHKQLKQRVKKKQQVIQPMTKD